jgi:hypothetical protein
VGAMLHCVIGKKHPHKKGQIVYVGSFPDWNTLDSLKERFKVSRAVIDALPETRKAREFAERHAGKVFCCYYQEHQRGGYAWNERNFTVTANRTESLDASHAEISKGDIILPRESEVLHDFARQCSNMARVLQTDSETGSSRYSYVKTGPDHFRHAFNYECMARGSAPTLVFQWAARI